MFPVISEEALPHKAFSSREEAKIAADAITSASRSGVARVQFTGAWDCWIVEVTPRAKPNSNPGVVRINGTIAKYN